MKFLNFRQLLIKKTNNSQLQDLVAIVKDEFITDAIIESLEKMAKHGANAAVQHFASELGSKSLQDMIYDALSHHASRYKAAIDDNRQNVANQHAAQLFKIMHLAHKAAPKSDGNLDVEAPSPSPWSQHTYGPSTHNRVWDHMGKDYSFLQKPPHEKYRDQAEKHGHQGAYPLENIRVNGKYLDIEDMPSGSIQGYKGHVFDTHPIFKHYKGDSPTAEYAKEHEAFDESPAIDAFYDQQDTKKQSNPEAFANRGMAPSRPVHKLVEMPAAPTATVQSADPVSSANLPETYKQMILRRPAANNAQQEPTQTTAPAQAPALSDHDHIRNANIPDELKNAILSSMKKPNE